ERRELERAERILVPSGEVLPDRRERVVELARLGEEHRPHAVVVAAREPVAVVVPESREMAEVGARVDELAAPQKLIAAEPEIQVRVPELPVAERLLDEFVVDGMAARPASLEIVLREVHHRAREAVLYAVGADQALGDRERAAAHRERDARVAEDARARRVECAGLVDARGIDAVQLPEARDRVE